jgi:hypothetical protein
LQKYRLQNPLLLIYALKFGKKAIRPKENSANRNPNVFIAPGNVTMGNLRQSRNRGLDIAVNHKAALF